MFPRKIKAKNISCRKYALTISSMLAIVTFSNVSNSLEVKADDKMQSVSKINSQTADSAQSSSKITSKATDNTQASSKVTNRTTDNKPSESKAPNTQSHSEDTNSSTGNTQSSSKVTSRKIDSTQSKSNVNNQSVEPAAKTTAALPAVKGKLFSKKTNIHYTEFPSGNPRDMESLYRQQGGTVIQDKFYSVIESKGRTRIYQVDLKTGQGKTLDGSFGKLSSTSNPIPDSELGHANGVDGIVDKDGSIVLWVAKNDLPNIAQVRIRNGKATFDKELKLLNGKNEEVKTFNVRVEKFDGKAVTLGYTWGSKGDGANTAYRTMKPIDVNGKNNTLLPAKTGKGFKLKQTIDSVIPNDPPKDMFDRIKKVTPNKSDAEIKKLICEEMKNDISMQEMTCYGNKAYALHSKMDDNGGSYTVVFEFEIPNDGSEWKPTGHYYYRADNGGPNTLYENEGIGLGSDGNIYLSGILFKHSPEGKNLNKGTRVEKTNLKAFVK